MVCMTMFQSDGITSANISVIKLVVRVVGLEAASLNERGHVPTCRSVVIATSSLE